MKLTYRTRNGKEYNMSSFGLAHLLWIVANRVGEIADAFISYAKILINQKLNLV